MKGEELYGKKFDTEQQLRTTLRSYILFYNDRRLHSSLRYFPPTAYESRMQGAFSVNSTEARSRPRRIATARLLFLGRRSIADVKKTRIRSQIVKKILPMCIGLIICSSLPAQEARTPEELAALVQKAIQTKSPDSVTRLIHPGASQNSVERYKRQLAAYHDASNLKVYPVPKDNAEAVRKFLALSPLPGVLKPLDERVKRLAENGSSFVVMPLGDIAVSGKREDARSEESISSAVYGKQDGKYFIVFAVQGQ